MFKGFDVTGWTFGRLAALGRIRWDETVYWVCACSCGNFTRATVSELRNYRRTSCGCDPQKRKPKPTKGLRRHPLYMTWSGMLNRCYRPAFHGYRHYGGRGIAVCPEWRDIRNFLAWAGERPEGHSLDRIDVDGPYSPENCRWATASQQASNKRPRKSSTAAR